MVRTITRWDDAVARLETWSVSVVIPSERLGSRQLAAAVSSPCLCRTAATPRCLRAGFRYRFRYRAAVRVVVNAVPARGTSLGVVTENLLKGWADLGLDDELHLVVRSGVSLEVPDAVAVHPVGGSRFGCYGHRGARAVPSVGRRRHAGRDARHDRGTAPLSAGHHRPRHPPRGPARSSSRPGRRLLRTGELRRRVPPGGCDRVHLAADARRPAGRPPVPAHRRRVTVAPLGADHVWPWPPPTGTAPGTRSPSASG